MKLILFILAPFTFLYFNPSNYLKVKINNFDNLSIQKDSFLQTGWYYVVDSGEGGFRRQEIQSDDFYYIKPEPIIVLKNISKLEIFEYKYQEKKVYGLKMKFNKTGTKYWSTATETSISKRLAFILNDKLIQAPKVNSRINGGISAISGFSKTELDEFVKTINIEIQKE